MGVPAIVKVRVISSSAMWIKRKLIYSEPEEYTWAWARPRGVTNAGEIPIEERAVKIVSIFFSAKAPVKIRWLRVSRGKSKI